MAQFLRRYEIIIIFDPDLSVDNIDDLAKKIRETIIDESGQIIKTERWGMRDLAFELKGRLKGYYLLIEFAGGPTVTTELERKLNLNDSILKFQTVKLQDKVDAASLPEEIISEVVEAPKPVAKAAAKEDAADEGEDEDDAVEDDLED